MYLEGSRYYHLLQKFILHGDFIIAGNIAPAVGRGIRDDFWGMLRPFCFERSILLQNIQVGFFTCFEVIV